MKLLVKIEDVVLRKSFQFSYDSIESLQHDHNNDQQAKGILLQNRGMSFIHIALICMSIIFDFRVSSAKVGSGI